MTGFDLPINYIDDPEALLKRTKAKLKKVLALESKDMADRTLRDSLLQPLPTSGLDPHSMLETMDLRSSWLSSTWCK